ncbi:MAG: AAA family ATPase [Candidatus Micrarchaeaceae archaeon]
MKYKELSIKNFRGIKSLEIKDIQNINILVGKNGCGKTSVLEALFLLSGMSNPLLPQNVNLMRELMFVNNDDFKYIFNDFNFSNPVLLEGKLDESERQLTITPKYEESPKEYEQNIQEITKNNILISSTKLKPSLSGIKLSFETDKKKYVIDYSINRIYVPVTEYKETLLCSYIYPKIHSASIRESIEKLTQQKKLGGIIEILKEIEPRISDIRIATGGLIYVDIGSDNLVPLNLLGDGIFKILMIISIMTQTENGVLLIDEIENGLYYTSLSILWKAIIKSAEEFNVQIIATTHSYECIENLSRIYSEDKTKKLGINLYRIRQHDNIHEAYSLDAETIKTGIENDFEVR